MRRSGSSPWGAQAEPLEKESAVPGRSEVCPRCGGSTRHLGMRFSEDGEVLEGGWCVDCQLYLRRSPDDPHWSVPPS